MNGMVHVGARVSLWDARRLRALARTRGMSLSALIRTILLAALRPVEDEGQLAAVGHDAAEAVTA